MRAAFLGTPAAAVASLCALADVADVDLVITRPDRPRRRSSHPVPPPVKVAAQEWGFEVAQPRNSRELLDALRGRDLDVAVVVAYGKILPREVLESTRVGFVNVHFSLLPRWRGAAPVEWAIASGDPVTGVSLMMLDEGLDTGPVIGVIETPISDDETGGSLTARLAHLGATLLDDALPGFMTGALTPAPQLGAGVTHAPMLQPAEARIDPERPREEIVRRIRAFHPRPGSWCSVEGERLKVIEAVVARDVIGPIGTIEAFDGRPVLMAGDGGIELVTVQPAGKRPVPGVAWMNGRRGEGAVLDSA